MKMSRIGELFAKSCVNGIYSHYNPAESPDPSTQLPVQPQSIIQFFSLQ